MVFRKGGGVIFYLNLIDILKIMYYIIKNLTIKYFKMSNA